MSDDGGAVTTEATREDDEREDAPVSFGRKVWTWVKEILIIVVSALVLSFLLKTFFFQSFWIPSASMENTLDIGDRILVSKWRPGPFDLRRGDIVVFRDPNNWLSAEEVKAGSGPKGFLGDVLRFTGLLPEDAGEHLVKRAIGLPGDTVECKTSDGPVYVNGVALTEPYVYPGLAPCAGHSTPWKVEVPADYVWVMGDNRVNSADSRSHMGEPGGGAIPMDHIVGTAFATVWPLDHWKGLGNPFPPDIANAVDPTAVGMTVTLDHERALWDDGAAVVAGIDEVGRGALAGPVAVGVVALARCETWPKGLADSKQLSPSRREAIAADVRVFGVARAVGEASNREVDDLGIVGALRSRRSGRSRRSPGPGVAVDAVLLDGRHDYLSPRPADLFAGGGDDVVVPPVTTVVRGDARCASIAAGSVLAKVARDAAMRAAHADHPEYGWEGNKGYGAPGHLDALRRLGPTPLHRVTWKLPSVEEAPPRFAGRAGPGHDGPVSHDDLENYETEAELALYREYRDVVGLFSYVVETERRFYLANKVDLEVKESGGDVYFDVTLTDAWVWDVYRSARLVRSVRVVTFRDVNVEELAHGDDMPDIRALRGPRRR